MSKPEGERIASVEKAVEIMSQQIEKLEKTMQDGFLIIRAELKDFRAEVQEGDKSLVTNEKFEEKITDLKREQEDIRKIATTRSWLMGAAGTLVGLIMSIIAGLLIFFFTHYKKGV